MCTIKSIFGIYFRGRRGSDLQPLIAWNAIHTIPRHATPRHATPRLSHAPASICLASILRHRPARHVNMEVLGV
ncbi:hypothetical protein WAI453_002544 [Rhynchosporium graminicola]